MHARWVIALVAAALLLPAAHAQTGVNPPALTAVGTGFPIPGAVTFAGSGPRFFPHRPILLGTPFLFPDYGYPSEPGLVQVPPPQVVVVQQPAAAEVPEPSKPGPLLIEWQGDRYVRVTGNEDRSIPAQPDYAETPAHSPALPVTARAASARAELPPAVLVFRDGARQEVREYVIVGGVLYAGGDYYQDGHWTRPIQVSSLDLRSTFEANEKRGVKFILPSGPYEVVTRP
ncbi:MAG TPA: hypothetical protein VMT28_01075 [Terriglobales bacterium]|jgi:hypothetical protein|nr:hypothetical protein [Terriglobales bacterium]